MEEITEGKAVDTMTMDDVSEMIASMRHNSRNPQPDESMRLSHLRRRSSLGMENRRVRPMRRNRSMDEMIASMRHNSTSPLPDESMRSSHLRRRSSLGVDNRRRRPMRRNTSMESTISKSSNMGDSSIGQSGISYSIYSAADYYGKDEVDSDSEVSYEREEILEQNIWKNLLIYALYEFIYRQLSGVTFAVLGATKRLCGCLFRRSSNTTDDAAGAGDGLEGAGMDVVQSCDITSIQQQMANNAASSAAGSVGGKN